ncbi:MAG: helix-turn-helix domain-containing protein [Phycisphaeraceae bacterium]|nr:MAG: helix-turn-helix domain-containing protein [Phycisphaeraceae bacterium]
MAKAKNGSADPVLSELVAIKRLLAFGLLRSGARQKQIAAALGVDQSQVSRMFPSGIGAVSRDAKKGA